MKIEIKVPAMGESISQATVSSLIKPTGSMVKSDEELVELETDKVNQVLYAPESGQLTWNVAEGAVVKVGDVLGSIDTDAKGEAPKEAPPAPKEEEPQEAPKPLPPAVSLKKETPPPAPSGDVRVTKEAFLKELAAPTPAPVEEKKQTETLPKESLKAPVKTEGRESRQKMTSIRKVIAKRMVEAKQSTAMLTTFNEIDMSQVMALREKYKESFLKEKGVKLGLMSFFVKASVFALEQVPEVNAYIEGDELIQRHYYDLGIAVGTDRGLVVPVVKDCDKLSFAEIEKAIEGYAKKAREGKLTLEDITGGGFTITNGGIYGSLLSTPILNPPQSGILGMHKIQKRAVVVDDQIVIKPMMYVALSYDHRVVDGKGAVSFLVHVKNCLEDPARFALEI